MILKEAEDKATQIQTLQGLAARSDCNFETRKRIEQEIRNIHAGVRGEQEAAYEMKVHYGETKNWIIIHDLRVVFGDLVAQIDHLVINRFLDMWVCESKHFSEGIECNEHGEFSAFFGGRPYGVASPIEQNAKHMLVLKRIFNSGAVRFPRRLGVTIGPVLKSLVLVSKKAMITRPKVSIKDIECVIKNDQFFNAVNKSMDGYGVMMMMSKIVGCDTVEDLGRQIVALHRPLEFNWAAKFGLAPSSSVAQSSVEPAHHRPLVNAEAAGCVGSLARKTPKKSGAKAVEAEPAAPKKKLVCHRCHSAVPYNVAKFCWFNKPKFGGNVFCMECQKTV